MEKRLTDKQLRIVQVIAGIISAAALLASIYIASPDIAGDNTLLQYLFLIVFAIVMFGRRWVENKFRLRLNLFSLVLIDGIIVGVFFYTVFAFYPAGESQVQLDDIWKTLILVGIVLIFLILGIGLPLRNYYKRKAAGTIRPVRLPEPKEKAETDDTTAEQSGPMTIEQQIAAMTNDLDKNDDNNKNE